MLHILPAHRLRSQVRRPVTLPTVFASICSPVLVMGTVLAGMDPLVGMVPLAAIAQSAPQNSVAALHTALQTAVCQNDWTRALQVTGMLIGSDQVSTEYRNQLMTYREQLRAWREARATVAIANCPTATPTAAPSTAPTSPTTAARPIDWDRAMESFNSGQPGNRPAPTTPTPRPTTAAAPSRRTPTTSRRTPATRRPAPSGTNPEVARVQQCNQMADIVNPLLIEGDRFMQTVTPDNYLQLIPGLIRRAENTNNQLRRLTLTNPNLRSYRQSLNSIYASLLPDVRNMVTSIRQGNLDNALRLRENVIRLAQQETAVLNTIISYCSY